MRGFSNRFFRFSRRSIERQAVFAFVTRKQWRESWFKRSILVATLAAIASILGLTSKGRYVAAAIPSEARTVARGILSLPTPREEIEASWKRFREQGIADSRRAHEIMFAEISPEYQRLLRYSGLEPGKGLLRWGNYDRTLLLPATIFEPDDTGRSYRFKPKTHSIWLRNLTLKSGVLMFFQVPDGPGLAEALHGTTGIPVETSRQTTNSWGLRGPEPEPKAPLRVLVLGDSYMQGMFVDDEHAPPECLRRYLEAHYHVKTSVLNTGCLGYSPEQYHASLLEFADRFHPQFIVESVCSNDFGDGFEVVQGKGEWDEAKYWMDLTAEYCRTHQIPLLVVPVPFEPSMFGRRKAGFYPGQITNVLDISSISFLDPCDDFINAHLELVTAGEKIGKRPYGCPLFNDPINDGHFSPVGAEVWAESVGKRIVLMLDRDQAFGRKGL